MHAYSYQTNRQLVWMLSNAFLRLIRHSATLEFKESSMSRGEFSRSRKSLHVIIGPILTPPAISLTAGCGVIVQCVCVCVCVRACECVLQLFCSFNCVLKLVHGQIIITI